MTRAPLVPLLERDEDPPRDRRGYRLRPPDPPRGMGPGAGAKRPGPTPAAEVLRSPRPAGTVLL